MNEDMAYGIENARIVVVFLSEPYFNSKNCKKELNYADILDKKGLLVHSMNTFQPGIPGYNTGLWFFWLFSSIT